MFYVCCPACKSLDRSIQDILRSLKLILSWQTSCRFVFKQATLFQTQSAWQLLKFRFAPGVLLPFQYDSTSASCLIRSWKSPSSEPNKDEEEDEDEDTAAVIFDTFQGKVHAEAALMYFITTLKVGNSSSM